MKKTFYITTSIAYPNAKPHVGYAYEETIADVFARYHRLKGEAVFFLTGTDENTQKVVESAKKANQPVRIFVDEKVSVFQELLAKWSISNDFFIRTTDDFHMKACQSYFQKSFDKGDIYKGRYDGVYCVGCEAYYTEKDLVNGTICPIHQQPVEHRSEDAYFFRLSNYQDYVLKLNKNGFIIPSSRANTIIARLESEPLRDLCVSRHSKEWGIPVPFDHDQAIYVWFDALLNYVTALGEQKKGLTTFWPANLHIVGHDIVWFHAVFWPAILKSVGLACPDHLMVHGFINDDNGQKMSKSIGNVVDPFDMVGKYPVDTLRYFLMRESPIGNDFNFSEETLKNRHNNELANELGNLLNRTLSLIEKNHEGKIPVGKTDASLKKSLNIKKIEKSMADFESFAALEEIFSFIRSVNQFTSQSEPWKMAPGKKRDQVLYSMADSLRVSSILLEPFIPNASAKIREQLGLAPKAVWKDAKFNLLKAGMPIKKAGILFPKLI